MDRFTRVLCVSLLALFAASAIAQSDSHITADPANELYRHSAWAHGYIHGYETGFHQGNLDLHLARGWRELKKIKQYHEVSGYKPEFGDKKGFQQGYTAGFEVGYADALLKNEFRAAAAARWAVRNLNAGMAPNSQREFDSSIAGGYREGRTAGLNDGRSKSSFSPERANCSIAETWCPAYAIGFKWGYSDGYYNQRQPEDSRRTAKK